MALQTGFESLLGSTTIWQQTDLQGLPVEQAYDELVFDLSSSSFDLSSSSFDLSSSSFAQTTTVSTADLINDEEDGSDDDGSKQIAHLQDRQFQEDLNTAMAMSLT
ncbi:hypothetical protein DFQ26_009595 [Actinomortierella ambigua]|nr:hypothetical protein DFQ26_009595 [Actinomortierella ambigua]